MQALPSEAQTFKTCSSHALRVPQNRYPWLPSDVSGRATGVMGRAEAYLPRGPGAQHFGIHAVGRLRAQDAARLDDALWRCPVTLLPILSWLVSKWPSGDLVAGCADGNGLGAACLSRLEFGGAAREGPVLQPCRSHAFNLAEACALRNV